MTNDADFFAIQKNIRTGSKRGHWRRCGNDILFAQGCDLAHGAGEVKDIPRALRPAAPTGFVAFAGEHNGEALSLASGVEHTTALEEGDGFRALIEIPAEGRE